MSRYPARQTLALSKKCKEQMDKLAAEHNVSSCAMARMLVEYGLRNNVKFYGQPNN